MVNFCSKKVNVIAYCLATLTTSLFLPLGDNLAGLAVIGGICAYWFSFMLGGLGISVVIYLIRIIFNRKNKFEFFMNTLWCSTLVFAILITASQLALQTSMRTSSFDHIGEAAVSNLAYIIIAVIFFYKRQQASTANVNKETSNENQQAEQPSNQKSWLEKFLSMEQDDKVSTKDTVETMEKQDPVKRERIDISRILGFWDKKPESQPSKANHEKNTSVRKIDYYYADGSTPIGPITFEELIKSPINVETKVWKTGLPDWVKANELPELQSYINACPPPLK